MITITPAAAAQIHKASEIAEADDMYLRIAARREEDGSIDYGMGFDDMGSQDQVYTSAGVDVLISDSCKDLLRGATLDYVELSPGQHEFIFSNPNDERHKSVAEDDGG